MENFTLVAPKFPVFVSGRTPSDALNRRPAFYPPLPPLQATSSRRRAGGVGTRPGFAVFAFGRRRRDRQDSERSLGDELDKIEVQGLTSTSSSGSGMTTSTSTPLSVPPPSYLGSPLLWIGVGVGLSAIFQTVAARVKSYALQQAFKTMMDQAAPRDAQFNNSAFASGPAFPFPAGSSSVETPSSPIFQTQLSSQPVEIDVQATEVETTLLPDVEGETTLQEPRKKQAFVDVSPEELWRPDHVSEESTKGSAVETQSEKVFSNGTVKPEERASSEQSQKRKSSSFISVEMLEKMMEDPAVQKMVYPHLPEEMRNPTTFKWMMQNPMYRQQLQDMLDNMNEKGAWNDQLGSLNNFDLSSPEIKQQFDQIGLTPEEAISRIMANPDVAMAFQNPKVQAAIMDLSQNPLSITKYQNDKEIMDVFNKISELFPGVTGRL